MALFNLSSVGDALEDVTEQQSGVSFVGLAKKWETEEDGKSKTCSSYFFCLQNFNLLI